MTVNSLLDDFKEELKLLFKHFRLKAEDGKHTTFNIFEHDLPVPKGEDEPEPFPYTIVKAVDGEITTFKSPETVRVVLVFGIYDDDLNNQGHRDILNVIDCVRQRFEKNNLLNNRYRILNSEKYPTRWTIQEDDTYPYFFGGMEMTFAIYNQELEDPYA